MALQREMCTDLTQAQQYLDTQDYIDTVQHRHCPYGYMNGTRSSPMRTQPHVYLLFDNICSAAVALGRLLTNAMGSENLGGEEPRY
ncbi:uncharacterized protein TrAFT101_003820 [Trichoderma asperellum]|uniref:uncharacterized protein n=1 Tax=Trichoderma asperellum TaxID=101201 RepID=UPI003324633D|nr:hypothetical protein TrAFT101_003820 [Trichoderma asperellum]